jgi:hypothetical protein
MYRVADWGKSVVSEKRELTHAGKYVSGNMSEGGLHRVHQQRPRICHLEKGQSRAGAYMSMRLFR